MSFGTEITGNSLSNTVTVNEHNDVFPEASLATEFTTVVPIGKSEPDVGFE